MRIPMCLSLILILMLGTACGEMTELTSTSASFEDEYDSSKLPDFDEELAFSCIGAGLSAQLEGLMAGDIDAVYDAVGDELIELCTFVIDRGSGLPVVYLTRGEAYRFRKQYNRAIGDFTEAIRLFPEYGVAHQRRGQVYMEKAQYRLAIDNLTKAIEFDSDSEETVFSFIYRAMANIELGNYRDALDDADKAIYLDPGNNHAHSLREEARRHFR